MTDIRVEEKRLLLGDNDENSYKSLGFPVNEEDDQEVPTTHIETAKYISRWYICVIFSLFGLMQGAIWNTWSPINESAACALGFTSSDIELLANWGPIMFLIFMPIVMWEMDRMGLRLPSVISSFAVALGTGLRCLPLAPNVLKYFIHAGQLLNGIAGCCVMAAPPMLSNSWFPPEERVTATSITSLFNYFGTGFGYIIGPAFVKQPSANYSSNDSVFCHDLHERESIRHGISNLMYFEFGVSTLIFVSLLAYFPSHPPKPPSLSAGTKRMDFLAGIKGLRHQQTFLIVAFTFSLVVGGASGWIGAFNVILEPLGVSQDEGANIGFFMSLCGCAVGLVMGWLADKFKGHIKLLLLVLFVVGFFSYLYFINMSLGWIRVPGFEKSKAGIWTVCIIIGITINAAVPLGMEMGADAAYPTSEATSASIIVWLFNLFSFILLFVLQFSDPSISNYLMLSFTGVSIPLMIFFAKEPRNRIRIDEGEVTNQLDDNTVET